MILAIPILIAVSLFLGWVLIKLTVNALPLFAGTATVLVLLQSTGSIGVALVAGLLAGLVVAVFGSIAFKYAHSGMLRLALALLFAVPAAVAAWHAVQGIMGHVMMTGGKRDVAAFVVAIIVGGMAWRRLTERAASTG